MSQRQSRAHLLDRRALSTTALLALALASGAVFAQSAPAASPTKAPKAGYYLDPAVLHLASLMAVPPASDTAVVKAELQTLHTIEATRTPAQVEAAKADDAEEDIFSFRTVLGPAFKPQALPLTTVLSERVHGEQSVAGADLKATFARPRPYQVDKALHPVCKLTEAANSYPSGHTLSGYLLAYTLAEMLPEKKQQILERADDYAHNRLVCGVHYPSDIEASRRVALAVFGAMMANPKFTADLTAAAVEVHAHLATAAVAAK